MHGQMSQEIQHPGLQQMKPVRKVSLKFTHELSVSRIQLLFKWLEGLRSAEELPFDNVRVVAGSRSDLTFKPTRACQDTLRDLLVDKLGRSWKMAKDSLSHNH